MLQSPSLNPSNAAAQDRSVFDPFGLDLQELSYFTWSQKYCLYDATGRALEHKVEQTMERVARALADVELSDARKQYWCEQFLWALKNGAIPAGRIMANAGAKEHKAATSTINCTVSRSIPDSMDGILQSLHEAGMTLKAGCGIGYNFSSLRPKGAYVSGAGAKTSGPLSFMDIFDAMCATISSAGSRRGAQMATFDISHPDILDFIQAKRQDGRLRKFNLSCLITDDFMEALAEDELWALYFPASSVEYGDPDNEIIWRRWNITEENAKSYITNDEGLVACKVYKRLPAAEIWDAIMRSTYEFGEPGFILVDRINNENNNWFCENIVATNPCGEQPLPPYGSCLLGSINLTRFVTQPFSASARFDFEKFAQVVRIFTRMLDNVVEINGLMLPQQRAEIMSKRRHGMGYTGLGSTMNMLCMRYGSEESVAWTEQVTRIMAVEGWKEGIALAEEKGPAPALSTEYEVTLAMLQQRPEMVADGFKVGDRVKGCVLMGRYSAYMRKMPAAIREKICHTGARFTHHTSIAPAGTISLSLGNNVSNGIEPSFLHGYIRNMIVPGKKTKQRNDDVHSYEFMLYKKLINPAAKLKRGEEDGLPDYFVCAEDISTNEHVAIQAAAQKWVDSSISKTVNVPWDTDFESFKRIYLDAYEQGLKGCTTFRYNPQFQQGVLINPDDLAKTKIRFELEDGTVIECMANDQIEYDGDIHDAANLYDAIKNHYYGRL